MIEEVQGATPAQEDPHRSAGSGWSGPRRTAETVAGPRSGGDDPTGPVSTPEDQFPETPADDPGGAPPGAASTLRPPHSSRHRTARSLLVGSVVAIGVVVVLFVVLGAKSGTGSAGPVVPVGSRAPGFSLPPLTGSAPVDLDALGKDAHHPVVLNFFASWCTPCQKETPLLAKEAAREEAEGGPVRFIGVDVNDSPSNALPFVEKAAITYPVGVDQSFRVTSGLYGLNGLPQTFYIDPDGTVVGHTIGAVDAAGLQKWTRRLNAEVAGAGRRPG